MCGRKPCKACTKVSRRQKRPKIGSMKKLNVKNLTGVAVDGVQIYLGIAAGKAVVNNVPQLGSDPLIGAGVQLAVAVLLGGGRGKFQKNLAMGMAANAAGTLVNSLIPGVASSLGITGGPGGSYINPGVSGRRIGRTNSVPMVTVE